MLQERTVERRKTESEATPGASAAVAPASHDEGELQIELVKVEIKNESKNET